MVLGSQSSAQVGSGDGSRDGVGTGAGTGTEARAETVLVCEYEVTKATPGSSQV